MHTANVHRNAHQQLTPWSGVLIKELIEPQMDKFLVFCESQNLFTVLRRACRSSVRN